MTGDTPFDEGLDDRFPVTERHTPDWFSMTARERSDADDPRGGMRGVIPERQKY